MFPHPVVMTLFCSRGAAACNHSCDTPSCPTFQTHTELLLKPELFTYHHDDAWSWNNRDVEHLKNSISFKVKIYKAEEIPQDTELFNKIVKHLDKRYPSTWPTGRSGNGRYFHAWVDHECECCKEVFKHEMYIGKWKHEPYWVGAGRKKYFASPRQMLTEPVRTAEAAAAKEVALSTTTVASISTSVSTPTSASRPIIALEYITASCSTSAPTSSVEDTAIRQPGNTVTQEESEEIGKEKVDGESDRGWEVVAKEKEGHDENWEFI